ncbi:MAG: acylphosphatase [Chitinophagaceae bacterium]|nr:acylphosphatase [Chitinophagaceae bacterium]
MNETLQIIVRGTVQGVYFRQSAKEQALALGIKGTVKNSADGSVNIVASGDHSHLQRLIDWCCKGPRQASVTDVHVEKIPFVQFEDFTIIKEKS